MQFNPEVIIRSPNSCCELAACQKLSDAFDRGPASLFFFVNLFREWLELVEHVPSTGLSVTTLEQRVDTHFGLRPDQLDEKFDIGRECCFGSIRRTCEHMRLPASV